MNTEKRAKEIQELGKKLRAAKTEQEKKTIPATMNVLDAVIKKEMGWKK